MRRKTPCPSVAVATALALLIGCGTADVPVLLAGDGGAPGSPGALAASAAGSDTRAAYCMSTGPALILGTASATCDGQVAQTAFRYALCTCDGYVSSHALTTDSFDSASGPYSAATARAGGSVGTDGNLNATAPITVGGSLWATDPSGLTTSAAVSVAGALHALGEVHSGPTLSVGADAWLAGGLQTSGDVTISGTLHLPPSAPLDVAGTRAIGATASGPVQVGPACDCDPSSLVDVASFAEAHRTDNDDAAMGVDPRALEDVQAPLSLPIPCGRAFFTRVGATAPVHLEAQGHVAIFIGADLSTTSDFVVDAPPGADVDLFVEGGVTVGGAFQVGSAAGPARARTYVGGTGTVNLQGTAQLAGNLYAPRAQLVLGGAAPTTLYGAIFAGRLSAAADLTIHYDESILGAAAQAGCGAPSACATCQDCGGQACSAGACTACTDDTQCCAPLVCRRGTCVAEIL
jgi:hypothetical protein